MSRAEVVQINPGDFSAAGLRWGRLGALDGLARQRQRRTGVGSACGRRALLAGRLFTAAQTDARLCLRA